MKRQYLGDSKDSFKWDYHHFLVEALDYRQLKIAWMMTPDDKSSNGRTAPELFPARQEILSLCRNLRDTRDPSLLLGLPVRMGSSYTVSFHDAGANPGRPHDSFFSNMGGRSGQVLLLDPDNGFEPERSATDRHVRYTELDKLMKTIPADNVVTVFQHHRRKKFPDDFARIRERIRSGHSTAIYWHSLMFVSISLSPETIRRVMKINREYAIQRPVKVIG